MKTKLLHIIYFLLSALKKVVLSATLVKCHPHTEKPDFQGEPKPSSGIFIEKEKYSMTFFVCQRNKTGY